LLQRRLTNETAFGNHTFAFTGSSSVVYGRYAALWFGTVVLPLSLSCSSRSSWSSVRRRAVPSVPFNSPALAVAAAIRILDLNPGKVVARLLPERARNAHRSPGGGGHDQGGRTCATSAGQAALGRMVTLLSDGATLADKPNVTIIDCGLVNAFAVPGGYHRHARAA
jgi:hypothetical protein